MNLADDDPARIGPDDYILLFWFFNLPDRALKPGCQGGDQMGFIVRSLSQPEQGWSMRYRFRYYRDAKIWESADERTWYTGTLHPADESVIETRVRSYLDALILACAGPQYRTIIRPEIFHVRGPASRLAELSESGALPEWFQTRREPV